MAALIPREASDDLWARAVAELPIEDKRFIDINCSDKLDILVHLYADVESSKQKSIASRWKYTRKDGQTLILRDVFDRIVRWIDMFKQVGDVASQYDPAHASLPWAAVRLVLQIAVNDSKKLALVMEGLALVAELICRHAVTEALYLKGTSPAAKELERAVVKLYACILRHLSKAKQYLEQSLPKRIIKSAVVSEAQLDSGLDGIHTAEADIRLCMSLVDRDDTAQCHLHMKDVLAQINTPFRRMNDDLRNIHDNLETSKRTKIVRWLSPEPYREHHNQARQGVLAGTGQWLLSHTVFQQWKNDSASSILWLHGIVGSGKSKLVSIVIDEAMKGFEAGITPQPVFFYCSRNPSEPTRSDPRAILSSIARQLSCLEPGKPLLKPLLDLYSKKEEEGFASGSIQFDESRALILQLIEQYPLTTIVIDAMDECNPLKRRELLQVLEDILRASANLVKIFVSSRNDVDIVLRLQRYPNLEIDCRSNSDDITRFVKNETEQLIKNGDLLQYSTSQAQMKELIITKVIKGAAGMFRWASMQLQYLCSFDIDSDIESSLGRLPPDLHSLYAELYEMLTTKPGEAKAMIFKNALRWLLCARRALKLNEFLCAVSIDPQSGNCKIVASKDLVLKICNSFIVFDSQLKIFRFAHLSVREFLEHKDGYDKQTSNALAAEVYLWTVLSTNPNAATKRLLSELDWHTDIAQVQPKELRLYADLYWPRHCKLARGKRRSGKLKVALCWMLRNNGDARSPIAQWSKRLQSHFADWSYRPDDWMLLEDSIPTTAFPSHAGIFVACAFDFGEQIEAASGNEALGVHCVNRQRRSPLHVAVRHGSCETLACLLGQDGQNICITQDILIEAAGSKHSGKKVMSLLLDRRGADVQITEAVLKEAAGNSPCGKDIMAILLDRRGEEVKITEDVVNAAARNWDSGEDMMTLLLDQRGTDIQITEEVAKVAAGNWKSSKALITLFLDRRGAELQITNEVAKEVAGNGNTGKDVMTILLDRRGAELQITEEVVKEAAKISHRGNDVLTLLLDRRSAEIEITEDIVKAAAGNRICGKWALTTLLNRRGSDVQITEEVVKAAAGNSQCGKDVISTLVDRRGADVQITEEVVKVAARNWKSGKDIITLFLDRRGADVPITEDVIRAAAGNSFRGEDILALLLQHRGAGVHITEEIVKTAAVTGTAAMMALLLKQRGEDIRITEEVVKAAARNWNGGKDIITLLLDRRGADVQITDEVVRAAAGNRYHGKSIMTLFLDRRGTEVQITEEVVKAAARTGKCGIMSFLLDRRGEEVQITEDVVKVAAGTGNCDMMSLLLDQRGADVQVTDKVVEVAARNGKADMMDLLLHWHGADIQIPKEAVEAAARNWSNGKDVLTLLLSQRGANVQITEDVVRAAAGNGNVTTMSLLLNRRGKDVHITEEVVKAAAGNFMSGKDMMNLLLDQRGAEVQITEEVIKAAAKNFFCGKDVISILLNRRGADVQTTDEVVKAAARDGTSDIMLLLLDQRGADVHITDEVVKAAAGNLRSGKELMAILIDRRGADVRVTEEVVKVAAGNGKLDTLAFLLDKRGADVQITEEVVKAAAGNRICGKDVMTLLNQSSDLDITGGVVEAAANSGQEEVLHLLDKWGSIGGEKAKWFSIARLYKASRTGHVATVRRLVETGVPPDTRDTQGETPLWQAAASGHEEVVRFLLGTNAVNVNVRNIAGRTAIFRPSEMGYYKVVGLLLEHGAQKDVTDNDGQTPLSLAQSYGQSKVVKILN